MRRAGKSPGSATQNHLIFERLENRGPILSAFVDQAKNLRGQGPFTIDESIAAGIGVGEGHLFAREGLKCQHLGFHQIPNELKFGCSVHTKTKAHFAGMQVSAGRFFA
jgi:hypothetical protein